MLGKNIKVLRKNKGYSQEALANQLNVVRQTVSKWEKGLSVPDAEMLGQIAEFFETPVSELLGSDIPEKEEALEQNALALQLAILNEQFAGTAVRKRQTVKRTLIGVGAAILALGIAFLAYFSFRGAQPKTVPHYGTATVHLSCTQGENFYEYEMLFDRNGSQILSFGGPVSGWYPDEEMEKPVPNAYDVIHAVERHYRDNGGTCDISITDNAF